MLGSTPQEMDAKQAEIKAKETELKAELEDVKALEQGEHCMHFQQTCSWQQRVKKLSRDAFNLLWLVMWLLASQDQLRLALQFAAVGNCPRLQTCKMLADLRVVVC